MSVLFVCAVQTAAAAKRLAKNEVKKAFCGFQFEERLCNDVGNEILTGPLPNPSETARLEIRTNEHEPLANANEHHQQHAHSSKQAKSKVV